MNIELSKVTLKSSHFKHQKTSTEGWKEHLIPDFKEIEDSASQTWRVTVILTLMTLAFFLLFLRLFHLQIAKGAENRSLADGNRIQIRVVHAPRGVILDRNGKVLAKNEPGFRLTENSKTKYISRDEALKLESNNDPNFKNLEIDNIRAYPFKEKTAHILGYVGQISPEQLKNPEFKNYRTGDQIGFGGVEEIYEKELKGVDGGEIIEVDAAGQKIRTIRKTESIPGKNLVLSIDLSLQVLSFDTLQETIIKNKSCCAALIGQDPNSGQILTLVSIPSFNPNKVDEALSANNFPMLNRVIAGTYPPGSTFKIASSLAGLQSGKVTPKTIFEDTGVIKIGPYEFNNWFFTQYGKTEGSVDIVKALKRSNDTYFYKLGELVGEVDLGNYSKQLGLGRKLNIDIPGEVEGLIPTDQWKQKNIGDVWYPGDTLHMAIGQGYVLATPLQINHLLSVISQEGQEFKPHLALKLTDLNGKVVKEFNVEPKKLNFKSDYFEVVKKGLNEVPKDGGTAWPFFNFPIATAGKTGTAEFGTEGKTHAWYTAYAPADDPKIVVTVLVEAGGEGSSVSSPVVKEIFRWFLSENKKSLIKDIGEVASDSARTLGE